MLLVLDFLKAEHLYSYNLFHFSELYYMAAGLIPPDAIPPMSIETYSLCFGKLNWRNMETKISFCMPNKGKKFKYL